MKKRLIVALFLILTACAQPEPVVQEEVQPEAEERIVVEEQVTEPIYETGQGVIVKVIDGDTYDVLFADGSTARVRLLGIDYPDISDDKINYWIDRGWTKSQATFCYHLGNELFEEALTGKSVVLYSDVNEADKDEYGRLLRYMVVVGDKDSVNAQMVYLGWAVMRDWNQPACSFCRNLYMIEQDAQTNNRGCLWQEN